MDLLERLEETVKQGPGGVEVDGPRFEALRRYLDGLTQVEQRHSAALVILRFAYALENDVKAPAPAQRFIEIARTLSSAGT